MESHFLLLISLFSHLPCSSPQFPLNLPPSVRHGDVDTRLSVVLGWLPPDTRGRVSGSVLDASDMADDHSFLPLPLFHSCPLRLLHGSLEYCHRVLDGFSLSISAVIRLPRCYLGTAQANYKATERPDFSSPEMLLPNEIEHAVEFAA